MHNIVFIDLMTIQKIIFYKKNLFILNTSKEALVVHDLPLNITCYKTKKLVHINRFCLSKLANPFALVGESPTFKPIF